MDCGIPFCHQGCPLGNLIPDWNDLVYKSQWKAAIERLHATNNFPEFTGKLCPAPCEASCVLGINDNPVTIKHIEASIVEMAWNEGWIEPQPPRAQTGKKVAVVGSGPAGLACAQQLDRAGHAVTVYERADRIGGLLRYGIPDFKMEKRHLDRRLAQMEAEGVDFVPGPTSASTSLPGNLLDDFDAVCLCGGATRPRDLPIEGRDFSGILFAMDYLTAQNHRGAGDRIDDGEFISAQGKDVIIIGGGDTGADCLGTVHRHGCKSVHQFEIVPRPPDERSPRTPGRSGRTSSGSHRPTRRGAPRILDQHPAVPGRKRQGRCARNSPVEMNSNNGTLEFVEIPGTERVYPADLVLLAMGFVGPEKGPARAARRRARQVRKRQGRSIQATSIPKVFTAGDMTRGQSLIVWAIAEGRQAARGIDEFLMGSSDLPAPLAHGLPCPAVCVSLRGSRVIRRAHLPRVEIASCDSLAIVQAWSGQV